MNVGFRLVLNRASSKRGHPKCMLSISVYTYALVLSILRLASYSALPSPIFWLVLLRAATCKINWRPVCSSHFYTSNGHHGPRLN